MKNYLLLVWLSIAGGNTVAKTLWNRGELVLQNGTVLTGELNYNWRAEIVQYRAENTIKAFSAFQVREFKYFDDQLNTLRKFVAMDYPIKPSSPRIAFLEEFERGPVMVYRRLRRIHEPIKLVNSVKFGLDEEFIKNIDNFHYYVLTGDKMTALADFAHTQWPQMQTEFTDEFNLYVAKLHIDLTSTFARLLLINRYNQLKMRGSQVPLMQETISL